jgi:hypothetical protein
MGHISVAIPASFPLVTLDVHVGDTSGVDDFGVEGSMTAYTVLHDDLCTLVDGLYSLSLLSRDELIHVVHTVLALEVILSEDIVMRYVAVVASGITSMRAMHPRGVVRGHDVAVDTGRGIVA